MTEKAAMSRKRSEMLELVNEDAILLPEEFDEAFIGFVEIGGSEPVALYDTHKLIDIYILKGMGEEEAINKTIDDMYELYDNDINDPAFATFWDKTIKE